ncbi:hypothetical protein AR1Y2_1222 [Anaerostipes rhamnosivorans]|uniref:Uncharacterized protein n=1 Tax=Anaerostipes rhamnosivorans TaxID=1229621 RepID=A0A4P8IB51_9FIRM|nr:hypothetical protein AR1Y2_1222 [Anaerostipes rhamnosivorans]
MMILLSFSRADKQRTKWASAHPTERFCSIGDSLGIFYGTKKDEA